MSALRIHLGGGSYATLEPETYQLDRELVADLGLGWRPGQPIAMPVGGSDERGGLTEVPRSEGIYLFHLEPAYQHAGHYLGWAYNLAERVGQHRRGTRKASPLIRAQLAAGGEIILARIWEGADRTTERRMKRQGGLSRHCPICRASGRWHR